MGYQNPPCATPVLVRVNDKPLAIKCRLRQEQSFKTPLFNCISTYIIQLRAVLLYYSFQLIHYSIAIINFCTIAFHLITLALLYSPVGKQSSPEVKHFSPEEFPFNDIMKHFQYQVFLYSAVLLYSRTIMKHLNWLGKQFCRQLFSFLSGTFQIRATIP